MRKRYINTVIFIIIILVTTIGGVYIGQQLVTKQYVDQNSQSADWHKLLHKKLNITDEQDKKLADIEKKYSQRRQYLEEKMHLANMELAEAIKADKSFSPAVQRATDKIHEAMGELQKATLEHLFEMQQFLTDEQNKQLEQLVTDALYKNK